MATKTVTSYLVMGGVCGLAWAASMRGWMAQLADGMPATHSHVSWYTFALVLLPGVLVGALLGWGVNLRRRGQAAPRWLRFAPLPFASALLDPTILIGFIKHGFGGGSLIVVATALAIGYTVSHNRWTVPRVCIALVALLGLLMMLGLGTMAAPDGGPRALWVSLYGFTHVLLLGLATSVAYPPRLRPLSASTLVTLGALTGFAWAAGLRGFMAALAITDGSEVTWVGTFGWVLLPGAAAGALLGYAEHRCRLGGPRRTRWLVLAPFTFTALLVPPLVTLDLTGFLAGGIGGGTIGVPVAGVLGAYAITGRRVWLRVLSSLLPLSAFPVLLLTAGNIGGPSLDPGTLRSFWVATYYAALLATLCLACTIPFRVAQSQPSDQSGPSFVPGDQSAPRR